MPVYVCPMHPEIRRNTPGDCPKCGMALEKEISFETQALYVCPMHPEVTSDKPGTCPKCGMSLELQVPAEVEEENTELKSFTHKLFVSVPLSLALIVIAMGKFQFDLGNTNVTSVVQFIIALPVIAWAGGTFFHLCWKSIRTNNPNMWTLIGIGTGAAFIYSSIATFFPSVFPDSFKTKGVVDLYFEAAAVIICFTILGQILELRARANTSTAIKSLLKLAPKTATLIKEDGTELEVLISEIKPNDLIRVRPGQSVPVDGVIAEGESSLDESLITGEPVPVSKTIGDKVIAGTINSNGSLVIRAVNVGSTTILAQIINLVAQAQRSKAPMQRMADSVSRYFVLGVLGIAVVTFFIWGVLGPNPSWSFALINSVAVLIIACPCALGLATPMSIMVASGRGATAGILFRDAMAIENLSKMDALIIDKTGTVTEGRMTFELSKSTEFFDSHEVLRLAASLEQLSEHPLARAIVKEAKEQELQLENTRDFNSLTGFGVQGKVRDRLVTIGNSDLMESVGADFSILEGESAKLRASGSTVMYVAVDNNFAGIISLSDKIKESSSVALEALKQAGIRIIMASGDNLQTVKSVADKLGIKEYRGTVKPADKLNLVKELQGDGLFVVMAGDGVNDAPALAQANIGIAMGTGTDVAMNSGQVTLVKGDLRGIENARKMSFQTVRNMKQNLTFAFLYNALGVPIAAGILYPSTKLLLSPLIAALAMSLSSASVITNSIRLSKAHL